MDSPIRLCCPRCRGALEPGPDRHRCVACAKEYPVVLGIPDLRVFPDPYIDEEADREKARRLAERAERTDFAGLLEHYWSITGEAPPDLVPRYLRHDLAGVARGRRTLQAIEAGLPEQAPGPGRPILELGCRTGGFLVAAAERSLPVVGVDIAFRWLVVARKRLEERGLQVALACCCAEALPFPDGDVALVVAGNVLEHVRDPEALLRESHRVLRPGGALYAVTCNRFSLGPEPHVRVWGVGFLPRPLMSPYVRWARGHPYRHIRLLSVFELRRLVDRSRFGRPRIGLPDVGEAEQEGLPPRERRLLRCYRRMRNWRLVRPLLLLFGPFLELACVREGPSS